MAKKKGTFANPFVPVEEQPYKIPNNWCWTYGSMVLEAMETQKPLGDTFDYIDIDAIDNQRQMVNNPKRLTVSEAPSRASRKLHAGDTVFSLVRPYLKNIAYIDDSLAHCIASTGFFVCTPKEFLNSRYLYQLMVSSYMVDGLNQYMKGDNSPSIRKDDIERFPFPIPPLSEQQRIVDRIESLFAKLDEAKEKAQAVVDGFELRKSVILHNAFTGKYTDGSDREKVECILQDVNKIKEAMIASKSIQRSKVKELLSDERISSFPASWKQVKLGEIAFVTKLAGFEYTKYIHLENMGDIPVIRAQNVRKGYLDTRNLLYIDKKTSELLPRSALDKKSILITFIGAGIGDVCVFDETQRFHLAPNVAKVEPYCGNRDNLINIRYILHYLMSHYGQHEIFKNMKATAQPSLSMETIRDIIIPVPDIVEQDNIVRILDKLLVKEQQAKQAAEAVLVQIDTMKKAILAHAFRGELGTNNPAEEWAGELVQKELKSDAPKQPRAKAVFIPEELETQLKSEVERKIIKLYLKNGSEALAIEVLMAVSSKKFEVMDALRSLEQREIIKKHNNGNYSLVR